MAAKLDRLRPPHLSLAPARAAAAPRMTRGNAHGKRHSEIALQGEGREESGEESRAEASCLQGGAPCQGPLGHPGRLQHADRASRRRGRRRGDGFLQARLRRRGDRARANARRQEADARADEGGQLDADARRFVPRVRRQEPQGARRLAGDAACLRDRRRRRVPARRRRGLHRSHAAGRHVLGRPLRQGERSLRPRMVDRDQDQEPLPRGDGRSAEGRFSRQRNRTCKRTKAMRLSSLSHAVGVGPDRAR